MVLDWWFVWCDGCDWCDWWEWSECGDLMFLWLNLNLECEVSVLMSVGLVDWFLREFLFLVGGGVKRFGFWVLVLCWLGLGWFSRLRRYCCVFVVGGVDWFYDEDVEVVLGLVDLVLRWFFIRVVRRLVGLVVVGVGVWIIWGVMCVGV